MFQIKFTKQAQKDYETLSKSPYFKRALSLLSVIKVNPKQPPVEKLLDQKSTYSRRINLQHRLVYTVYEEEQIVVIIRMWTHYGDN